MRLILASTSPYRRELLGRLRVPFECVSPGVDEEVVKRAVRGPREIAVRLARLKAEAVLARCPDAVVIGGDQVAAIGDEILDKPGSPERAREQLGRLQGRTHQLYTAIAVFSASHRHEHLDVTRLAMRGLDEGAIDRYLAADEPWDCAGSYKLESLGIGLFDRIDSDDQTAVTGLPLMKLARILREVGFAVP